MSNKIFIFEFVSGGGFNKSTLPISLFCEGFAMLRACIEDFKSIDFEIETLLDDRISKLNGILVANTISFVKKNDDFIKIFKKILINNDYVFIIAPEFQNILYNLTKLVEDNEKNLLSVGSDFIQQFSSKYRTYEFFQSSKLNTPKTYLIPSNNNGLNIKVLNNIFEKLRKPIILKPEDGVGAESIFFIDNVEKLNEFIKQMNSNKESFIERPFIIQEYVSGQDLSVSFIGRKLNLTENSYKPLPICINAQILNISKSTEPSQYFGGYSPIVSVPMNYLNQLVSALSKFKVEGYFGVDFIKYTSNPNPLYFIEINPRLTTSYLGIRNVFKENLFDIIYNSKLGNIKDLDFHPIGFSHYRRLDFSLKEKTNSKKHPDSNLVEFLFLKNIPEIITPPISINGFDFSSFVATNEKTLMDSENKLQKIKNKIKQFLIIS